MPYITDFTDKQIEIQDEIYNIIENERRSDAMPSLFANPNGDLVQVYSSGCKRVSFERACVRWGVMAVAECVQLNLSLPELNRLIDQHDQ